MEQPAVQSDVYDDSRLRSPVPEKFNSFTYGIRMLKRLLKMSKNLSYAEGCAGDVMLFVTTRADGEQKRTPTRRRSGLHDLAQSEQRKALRNLI
jgi:hypothetical protein